MTKRERRREGASVSRKRQGESFAAAAGVLGTVLLVALLVLCLPLTVPRFFGYHIYSVVSGSMEPPIPTGSLVYIRTMEPEKMQEGDVIAFYGARDQASIITHRVVENRAVMGEFITKGDANQTEDMTPIPYEHYIGKVVQTIPGAGTAAELLTSPKGKAAAGSVILAAVLLQMLASIPGRRQKGGGGSSDGCGT